MVASNFESDRHAVYVGWVLGVFGEHHIPATPVVDGDGDYTDRITLDLPHIDGTITVVVPPPDDGWDPS